MNTRDRIERVPLTVSEKFLTVLSLLWVSLRYHFIGRNIENTHEKRTVRYKSQLICIYICHQFFFEPYNEKCFEILVFWCLVCLWLSFSKRRRVLFCCREVLQIVSPMTLMGHLQATTSTDLFDGPQ